MNETTFETEQISDPVTEPFDNSEMDETTFSEVVTTVPDSEMGETTFSEVVTTVTDYNISDQLTSIENISRAELQVLLVIFFTIAGILVSRIFGSFFKM